MAKQVALVNAAIPYTERRSTRLLEEAADSKMTCISKTSWCCSWAVVHNYLKHSDRAEASCISQLQYSTNWREMGWNQETSSWRKDAAHMYLNTCWRVSRASFSYSEGICCQSTTSLSWLDNICRKAFPWMQGQTSFTLPPLCGTS
jgi:hypothetical protein